eukprot:2019055-Pleurochrysis_carterae.AAC.1
MQSARQAADRRESLRDLAPFAERDGISMILFDELVCDPRPRRRGSCEVQSTVGVQRIGSIRFQGGPRAIEYGKHGISTA